jgi:hypothetical protein
VLAQRPHVEAHAVFTSFLGFNPLLPWLKGRRMYRRLDTFFK